jgi:hypothetical protein
MIYGRVESKVGRCTEEKRNFQGAVIFGVDESNIQLWQKHKTEISKCETS